MPLHLSVKLLSIHFCLMYFGLVAAASAAAVSSESSKQQHQRQESPNDKQSYTKKLLRSSSSSLGRRLAAEPGHLQSGADDQGNSFAAAGVVNADTNTLHIVGTTYGTWWGGNTEAASGQASDPACFYAVAKLPQAGGADSMSWVHTEVLGVENVEEGCRDVLIDPDQSRTYIVGNSDPSGLLDEFFNSGGVDAQNIKEVGLILDLTPRNSPNQPMEVVGGRMLQDYYVSYPVAIAGDQASTKFYVASMLSDDPSINSEWQQGQLQVNPTLQFHFGSGYTMKIREYNKNYNAPISPGQSLRRSVEPGVSGDFATVGGESIFVRALLELPDRVIVAGHTKGTGVGFNSSEVDAGGMDGFVTQLSQATLDTISGNSTYRVRSGGGDDFVTGACFSPNSPEYIFVTGYSDGFISDPNAQPTNSVRAFVLKLQLSDMTPVWIQEFEATPEQQKPRSIAKAMACVLTDDGNDLYVAGVVEDGGLMDLDVSLFALLQAGGSVDIDVPPESFGETDVWIAQIDSNEGSSNDGKIKFLRQFGSREDDTIAERGGLQVDNEGNAVLIGNTAGGIYRDRTIAGDNGFTDVFIATFQRTDGSFVIPLEHDDFNSLPPHPPQTRHPTASPMGQPAGGTTNPTPAPTPQTTNPPTPATTQESNNSDDDDDEKKFPIHSLILLFVLLVLVAACMCRLASVWGYLRPKKDIPTDRLKVLLYLHDFDVEDVELKHSATGGWHCSYMNDLAKGINKQVRNDTYAPSPPRRGSAYDPLNIRRSNSGDEPERFSDEILEGGDDEGMSFGSSRASRRESRRERRGGFEGLLRGTGSSQRRKSRRDRNRSVGSADSLSGSFSAGSGSSSPSRRDRARERWQNREII